MGGRQVPFTRSTQTSTGSLFSPQCGLGVFRLSALLIPLVSTRADSEDIDLCRTKIGVIDPLLGNDRVTSNYTTVVC
jgi:hypothetical protein